MCLFQLLFQLLRLPGEQASTSCCCQDVLHSEVWVMDTSWTVFLLQLPVCFLEISHGNIHGSWIWAGRGAPGRPSPGWWRCSHPSQSQLVSALEGQDKALRSLQPQEKLCQPSTAQLQQKMPVSHKPLQLRGCSGALSHCSPGGFLSIGPPETTGLLPVLPSNLPTREQLQSPARVSCQIPVPSQKPTAKALCSPRD